MKRFNGNSQSACQHWGQKLPCLKWHYDDFINEVDPHPFNDINPYDTIEAGLADTVNKVGLLQNPGKFVHVERWTINLDKRTLGLESNAFWSFKSIYYMSKNFKDCMNIWLDECSRLSSTEQKFHKTYAVVLIQSVVRRFLAVRRSFQPDIGLQYLLGKKRFEELQGNHDAP
jgi:hypothetical protein